MNMKKLYAKLAEKSYRLGDFFVLRLSRYLFREMNDAIKNDVCPPECTITMNPETVLKNLLKMDMDKDAFIGGHERGVAASRMAIGYPVDREFAWGGPNYNTGNVGIEEAPVEEK